VEESPLRKLMRLRVASNGPEEVLPAGLAEAFPAGQPARPLLAFPYENYIPAVLHRKLLAPVFSSYNASTIALQQLYIARLESEGSDVDIVYGADHIASPMLENIQAITRVPLIFEHLYRNFGLSTSTAFGTGFYLLRRKEKPRDLMTRAVTGDTRGIDAGRLEIRLHELASCSLVRLELSIRYSAMTYLGRPTAVDLIFHRRGKPFLKTGLVAIEPNVPFATYVSLIPHDRFFELFGTAR
jgi:hypothetical protein